MLAWLVQELQKDELEKTKATLFMKNLRICNFYYIFAKCIYLIQEKSITTKKQYLWKKAI